jgi:hypothetical protein
MVQTHVTNYRVNMSSIEEHANNVTIYFIYILLLCVVYST